MKLLRNLFLKKNKNIEKKTDRFKSSNPVDADWIRSESLENDKPVNIEQKTQPFIFILYNSTDNPIENIELFDAAGRFPFKGLYKNGVKIKYGVSIDISYKDFIISLLSEKFRILQTRLVGSSDKGKENFSIEQSSTPFTIKNHDLFGNMIIRPFAPKHYKEDRQEIKEMTDIYFPFILDSRTSFKIGVIYPFTTLKIYLYPENSKSCQNKI